MFTISITEHTVFGNIRKKYYYRPGSRSFSVWWKSPISMYKVYTRNDRGQSNTEKSKKTSVRRRSMGGELKKWTRDHVLGFLNEWFFGTLVYQILSIIRAQDLSSLLPVKYITVTNPCNFASPRFTDEFSYTNSYYRYVLVYTEYVITVLKLYYYFHKPVEPNTNFPYVYYGIEIKQIKTLCTKVRIKRTP